MKRFQCHFGHYLAYRRYQFFIFQFVFFFCRALSPTAYKRIPSATFFFDFYSCFFFFLLLSFILQSNSSFYHFPLPAVAKVHLCFAIGLLFSSHQLSALSSNPHWPVTGKALFYTFSCNSSNYDFYSTHGSCNISLHYPTYIRTA